MKITGFSFVRNAIKYDYPVVESIKSILPLVDEFVIAVGNSEDGTREMVAKINPDKIRIIDTVWDDSLRKNGRVLAVETDKALKAVSPDTDWVFYLQADEVVHENDLATLKSDMEKHLHNKKIEGLLLKYNHFYGSYDYIANSRRWYRNEIRVLKNLPGLHSFRDAQGFRIDDRIIRVVKTNARIFHYGWVKPPSNQQSKQEYFHSLWHDDEWVKNNIKQKEEFDYSAIESLKRFGGTHPAVMQKRIADKNWEFNFDERKRKYSLKYKLLHLIEDITGYRIGEYKNYRVMK